ncbi:MULTISPECIES: TetR/AcrR family transcriptional regulator [Bradyrhizobium]|uniref:TetR/AcrR family transcriptional repressor of nem operon n=1 Tax=Bradyrhizobium elkanii TaxID=29448 RepID=A0ABV4EQ26_BRAEL|nr:MULTISPECIES: TetR/AcrR family transcriptional regulator [Bradyrhizobium]MCP1758793.1 TetR/AcrR family transcriptional repressor of nem operon [Bradyrhizobium elkanii]MCP1984989.1 TetR/AcrR family transcriptional repressor of nem operon [Bradyrhizobium elkanii]MCS3890656.1 TetR/AcrR family transcriptional repressor of nem operon [Bradyrhizobium elkanii]MCS4220556.1 TetR/AcrR family transcriptional repressor of nem operon [Bradyrhizobium elkanii]MCW2197865.1 TetR/AcrR family transcriptional 
MARPREFDEDRVLEAVMETFWSNGYRGTSAQALVDATGLGRGSLYAAYVNKHGLLEQALLRYRSRAQAHAAQLRAPGSPVKRLRKLMQDMVDDDLKASRRRGCLATNSAIEVAGRDGRISQLVRENFAILRHAIEETVRRAQVAGEIPARANPKKLGLFLFNAVQGLRVLGQTTPVRDRALLTAIIDQTLASLK